MKKYTSFIKCNFKNIIIVFLLFVLTIVSSKYAKTSNYADEILKYRITNVGQVSSMLQLVRFEPDINIQLIRLQDAEKILDISNYPFGDELYQALKNYETVLEIESKKEDKNEYYLSTIGEYIDDISFLIDDSAVTYLTNEQNQDVAYDNRNEEIIDKITYINNFCEIILNGN